MIRKIGIASIKTSGADDTVNDGTPYSVVEQNSIKNGYGDVKESKTEGFERDNKNLENTHQGGITLPIIAKPN
jgi:hypothetical protein